MVEREESKDTLKNVSPFLWRNGYLLLQTKTVTQVEKLIHLTSFNPAVKASVSEHMSLKYSKGGYIPQRIKML